MQIGRARLDDFPDVQALLDQLMPGSLHRRQATWNGLRQHPGSTARVAAANDVLLGFLDLFVFPDLAHGESIAIFSNLIMSEAFRGHRLGTRLLREAIEQSRRERAVEVHVWTEFDNTRAIHLSKDAGFTERALLLELALMPADPSAGSK